MKKRGVLVAAIAVILVGVVGFMIFSMRSRIPDEVYDVDRWEAALAREIEGVGHVAEVIEASYAVTGPFTASHASVVVELTCDSSDPDVNRQVLNDAARAVAVAMIDNPAPDSRVLVTVYPRDPGVDYTLKYDVRDDPVVFIPSFGELADYYGIPR